MLLYLPLIISQQRTIKFTPLQIMFGREFQFPLETEKQYERDNCESVHLILKKLKFTGKKYLKNRKECSKK